MNYANNFEYIRLLMMLDVRLVDEEGTPMSTPNTSGDDDSEDEVGSLSPNSSLIVILNLADGV